MLNHVHSATVTQRAGTPAAPLTAWLRCWLPRPQARVRLLCLPHAGGSASFFRPWSLALPAWIEMSAIQYPGREDRINEEPVRDLPALAAQIAQQLQAAPRWLDRPYLLFGHSMGAALAYELSLALWRAGCQLPGHLLLSASEAPSRRRPSRLHAGPDAALIQEVLRLGGTRAAAGSSPELVALILPALRGDYQAIETYAPRPDRPCLTTPITALVGDSDTELFPCDAQAWAEETTGAFTLRRLPGGHFYLVPQQAAVLATVLEAGVSVPQSAPWPSTP